MGPLPMLDRRTKNLSSRYLVYELQEVGFSGVPAAFQVLQWGLPMGDRLGSFLANSPVRSSQAAKIFSSRQVDKTCDRGHLY